MGRSSAEDEFINELVDCRRNAGLSQRDVAARSGLDKARVCTFERSKWSPTLHTILRYADAVGVRIEII